MREKYSNVNSTSRATVKRRDWQGFLVGYITRLYLTWLATAYYLLVVEPNPVLWYLAVEELELPSPLGYELEGSGRENLGSF